MRAFLALLLVAAATAELAPLLKNSEPIPGKYIIKLKDEYDIDEIASAVSLTGGRVGNKFRRVLRGFAADLSDRVLDVVRSLEAVEYVEQEGVYTLRKKGTGSGYTVWVIDTGVRNTHEEFSGRAQQVVNYAGGENEDCNGHGTHCAGIVGSDSYGVATEVQIRGVKTLNCFGSGSTGGILSGCEYVIANADGNSIASMSVGGGASTSLDDAVSAMIAAGIPTAVSAGGSNADACNYSPARVSAAITVGATDSSDTRSSSSNYGSCLDIFAPGVSITSTWYTSDTATATLSGTSMACPHVAGAIALYGKSTEAMLANASNDKISDVGESVNKLLYV